MTVCERCCALWPGQAESIRSLISLISLAEINVAWKIRDRCFVKDSAKDRFSECLTFPGLGREQREEATQHASYVVLEITEILNKEMKVVILHHEWNNFPQRIDEGVLQKSTPNLDLLSERLGDWATAPVCEVFTIAKESDGYIVQWGDLRNARLQRHETSWEFVHPEMGCCQLIPLRTENDVILLECPKGSVCMRRIQKANDRGKLSD
jgi:hypothetical protein